MGSGAIKFINISTCFRISRDGKAPPGLPGHVLQLLHPAEVVRGEEGEDGRVGDGPQEEDEQEVEQGQVPLDSRHVSHTFFVASPFVARLH